MTVGDDSHTNMVDDARSACLCDVGSVDYVAVTAVAADGSAHLILALRDAIGTADVRYDRDCADVAHEQLGALPARFQLGVTAVPIRCGHPTRAGRPCRIAVTHPGPCAFHRQPTTGVTGVEINTDA